MNEVIVSEEFAERFKRLGDCLPGIQGWGDLLPPQVARLELACFREAYPELLVLAREDIDPLED